MNHAVAERRLMRRLERQQEHGIVATRVRPGHHARLIDVSAGGALIETNHRLLPGTSVELHMETETGQASARGRVLRCRVVTVRPSAVSYQGAIRFDRHLPWFVEESGKAVGTSDSRPLHPSRAAATPEVI
jgi:PilZ domain-containing protein